MLRNSLLGFCDISDFYCKSECNNRNVLLLWLARRSLNKAQQRSHLIFGRVLGSVHYSTMYWFLCCHWFWFSTKLYGFCRASWHSPCTKESASKTSTVKPNVFLYPKKSMTVTCSEEYGKDKMWRCSLSANLLCVIRRYNVKVRLSPDEKYFVSLMKILLVEQKKSIGKCRQRNPEKNGSRSIRRRLHPKLQKEHARISKTNEITQRGPQLYHLRW